MEDNHNLQILNIIKDRVEPLQNEFDSDAILYNALDSEPNTDAELIRDPTIVEIHFGEDTGQNITMTKEEDISVNMSDTLPVIPLDSLKKISRPSNTWKSRNRPAMKRCRRSEVAEAREKLGELSEARKEFFNLEMEQMKEKHSAQMQLIKLQTENEQLRKEAQELEIKYYKNKLSTQN